MGYYWSRSVIISLDELNVKKYQLISVRIVQHLLKCCLRLTNINRYFDRIILTNYWLILTNYQLTMTETEYVEYQIVLFNIGLTSVKQRLAGSVKHLLIQVNFFYEGNYFLPDSEQALLYWILTKCHEETRFIKPVKI